MRSIPVRLILSIGIALVASAGFHFALTLITGPPEILITQYTAAWIFNTAFAGFINTVISVTAAAIIFSFAWLFSNEDIGMEASSNIEFFQMARSVILIFIVLTFLCTILLEIVLPGVNRSLNEQNYQSSLVSQAREQAAQAMEEEDYPTAKESAEIILSIINNDLQATQMLERISSHVEDEEEAIEADQFTPVHQIEEQDAQDLYLRALQFMESEDYFTAHYYATLSRQTDPSYEPARRLASEAWQEIRKMSPNREDEERYALYQAKRRGYIALQNDNPIEAYYIFHELIQDHPLDTDVQRYHQQAVNDLRVVAFFYDEMRQAFQLPGQRRIIFINNRNEENTEVIYIDKAVNTENGVFAFNIEAISFTRDNEIDYHLTAEYGKVIAGHLSMHCINREVREESYTPEYLAGSRLEGMEYIINLTPQAQQMMNLGLGSIQLESANLIQLWGIARDLDQYGYRSEPVQQEFLFRLSVPFSFIILAFVSLAFGHMLRFPVRRKKNYLLLIFIPALPFIIYSIQQLYFFSLKIVIGALLLATGFLFTQIIAVCIMASLLVIVLFFVAFQFKESK
ncbi:MAG: LptF/LptG family permease [Spirochaetia bacterium]